MPPLKNKEKILRLLDEIPEKELGKVVALLEKLRNAENKNVQERIKAIYEVMGSYKDKMRSSEEFMKSKAEEKLLDR